MKGCYSLLVKLERDKNIKVGKLGWFKFPKGYYVYTGSAKNNLLARVRRHLQKNKKKRWHIDYLLSSNVSAKILKIYLYLSKKQTECKINSEIKKLPGAELLINGFGASDCKAGCQAHLLYFKRKPKNVWVSG